MSQAGTLARCFTFRWASAIEDTLEGTEEPRFNMRDRRSIDDSGRDDVWYDSGHCDVTRGSGGELTRGPCASAARRNSW
jgi:hypothetical protein